MQKLYTVWGENLNPKNVLQEYPRPKLERDSYVNLNGYWDYAITKTKNKPQNFDGKILVPFSPEASLSGVEKTLKPDEYLHYSRQIEVPKEFVKEKIILHFGAIDQIAEVYVNETLVATHIGGFTSFSTDITQACKSTSFTLYIRVKDYSDTSYHQTGKQRSKRGGIWYTPQSGIWQTVWMESVDADYITNVIADTNIDDNLLTLTIEKNGRDLPFDVTIFWQGQEVAMVTSNQPKVDIKLPNVFCWSPENPNLYDIKINYGRDKIKSYVGFRKIEKKTDENGIPRFYLNNQLYFTSGLLDQGYYPDGLLTAPSEDAYKYDITMAKDMGFNMLRKHIKIEPDRFYYLCDKIGMIVWQDMVNGGELKGNIIPGIRAFLKIKQTDTKYKYFGRANLESRKQYHQELTDMIKHLYSHPCICVWVPFNEGWGQFDSIKTTEYIRSMDSSRLIDHASGWFDQKGGDFDSQHIYFVKLFTMFNKKKIEDSRILALTEFGGYSISLNGHRYNTHQEFGYRKFQSIDEYRQALQNLFIKEVIPAVTKGLGVAIYTQVSDVEDETNGLVTYDRKVVKADVNEMRKCNNICKKSYTKAN